jgi:hypothetical protein
LTYILWQNLIPKPDQAFDTEQARIIALAPLNGQSFQRDNATVYGSIKQLVLEGPGGTYILRFVAVADGRAAWLALHNHHEGNGFRNHNVDDAYSMLDQLSYTGKKKGFTFEKFVKRHMECFLELSHFDKPILETKKVRNFLNCTMTLELQAFVQQVKATEALMTNFDQAANFISLSVQPIKPQSRSIGSLNTDSGGRHHTGRVRGNGHQQGRGGHAPGQGRGYHILYLEGDISMAGRVVVGTSAPVTTHQRNGKI